MRAAWRCCACCAFISAVALCYDRFCFCNQNQTQTKAFVSQQHRTSSHLCFTLIRTACRADVPRQCSASLSVGLGWASSSVCPICCLPKVKGTLIQDSYGLSPALSSTKSSTWQPQSGEQRGCDAELSLVDVLIGIGGKGAAGAKVCMLQSNEVFTWTKAISSPGFPLISCSFAQ